jgi:hypothetical protein
MILLVRVLTVLLRPESIPPLCLYLLIIGPLSSFPWCCVVGVYTLALRRGRLATIPTMAFQLDPNIVHQGADSTFSMCPHANQYYASLNSGARPSVR